MRAALPQRARSAPRSPLRQAVGLSTSGLIAVGVFSFFINLLMLVSPLYMLQIYDRVLSSRSESTLLLLSLIVGAMLLVMGLLEIVRSRVLVRVSTRMDKAVATRVFEALFARNALRRMNNQTQALRDVDNVRQFISGQGPFAFFDAPWAPIYIGIVFLFHPLLGVVALGGAVVLFVFALLTEWRTRGPLTEANQHAAKANTFAEASLRNGEALQAMGMLPGIMRRWHGFNQQTLERQALASDRAGTISGLTKFVRLGVQSAILGTGAWLAIHQIISPGAMIAASIIMGRGLAPIEQAIGSWRQFVAARGAWARLDDLLMETPAAPERMALPPPKGHLAVERAVVAPPGADRAVLKGVSFALEPGEALGLVGPSASGKSTLARALIGVWPVQAGSVRLDGADVFRWDHAHLGPHLGYLPQEVEVLDGTVAANIARFADEIDPGAVSQAAQKAGVHDMILRLPEGYDTLIGPHGIALSGGQRQRIGLARALYGNPRFVVLDEPNSNLDAEGEAALSRAIDQLRQEGCTLIISSHRPNVMQHVDKILMLRDGVVEMFGPRQEILQRLTRPANQPKLVS
ncbi:MAG: type I secretion system permease/ATPase [Geminicoccaceae bacterium]|nr:MAG: type I secretion system permease/ATPase [Geminicoccaceae bacterium]